MYNFLDLRLLKVAVNLYTARLMKSAFYLHGSINKTAADVRVRVRSVVVAVREPKTSVHAEEPETANVEHNPRRAGRHTLRY